MILITIVLNSCGVKYICKKIKKILLGLIVGPPNSNMSYLEHLSDSLENALNKPTPVFLIGDFKPQFELLRTLTSRMTADVKLIDIITNYLEDKLVKEEGIIERVRFTTL